MPHVKTAEFDSREFPLTDMDFRTIVSRVKHASGIVLGEAKRELVYGRLVKRLRTLGCDSFTEYLRRLDGPDAVDEHTMLVNAITTNLTSFFRETHHFDALAKKILPEFVRNSARRRLRIWSAGCSSGQEPYTIAMVLGKTLPDLQRWDALVLATDIDSNMVARAKEGIYDVEDAVSIPARFKTYVIDRGNGQIGMSDELKGRIRFKRLNLIEPWPMSGSFEIIFCRNVVIYFDKDTQRDLFNRYADMLCPGGWLFIGHSESLNRVSERFRHLGDTIYRKIA